MVFKSDDKVFSYSLAEMAARTAKSFASHYTCQPTWIVAAPGRINLIGEHVDYCEGLVLPMTVDRHVVLAAAPSPEQSLRVFSMVQGQTVVLPLARSAQAGLPNWARYMSGVFEEMAKCGMPPVGLDILVSSDIPMGAGLSSSAALEVATATLMEEVHGQVLPLKQKALLCHKAEHDYVGVPCGIMDQFASVFGQAGHALLIDCRSQQVRPLPWQDDSVTVLVVQTNVRHELGMSEYGLRRQQCADAAQRLGFPALRDATLSLWRYASVTWPDGPRRCARHVITEIERTEQAAEALVAQDWKRFGALMYASHASLRDEFRVSCDELDLIVDVARDIGVANGVYGCRLTGAGFGGSCVALVRTDQAELISDAISQRYASVTGEAPSCFTSMPVAGAGPVEFV